MSHTMPLRVETRAPEAVVPAFCEECGEKVTGLRTAGDLPFGYRHRFFKLFAGTCRQCRDRLSGQ